MSASDVPVGAPMSRAPAGPQSAPRWLLASLVASFALPLAAYTLVRPHVASDAVALAVGAVFPATWTAIRLAISRRLDPVGAISLATLSLALLFALLSGGDPLLLKLEEAPLTGAFGLALLVSVVVRRPLLPALLRLAGHPLPVSAPRAAVITGIVGATLVVEALVRLALALALSTASFLELHRPVSWAIWGIGVLVLLATRGRAKPARQ